MDLLRAATDRVSKDGLLAFATWRFGEGSRFDRHLVPWNKHNSTTPEPIAIAQLEEGDHLLSFGERMRNSGVSSFGKIGDVPVPPTCSRPPLSRPTMSMLIMATQRSSGMTGAPT